MRDIARHGMPGAQEFLYYDAINYSLSSSPIGRICYIRPLKNRVTLGFIFGRQLQDPGHLLRGIGKRARYVRVRTMEDAKNHALKELVKAAWNDGADSIAALKQLMRKQRAALRQRATSGRRTKRARNSRTSRRRPR